MWMEKLLDPHLSQNLDPCFLARSVLKEYTETRGLARVCRGPVPVRSGILVLKYISVSF